MQSELQRLIQKSCLPVESRAMVKAQLNGPNDCNVSTLEPSRDERSIELPVVQ